jgi:hypothetical protein
MMRRKTKPHGQENLPILRLAIVIGEAFHQVIVNVIYCNIDQFE